MRSLFVTIAIACGATACVGTTENALTIGVPATATTTSFATSTSLSPTSRPSSTQLETTTTTMPTTTTNMVPAADRTLAPVTNITGDLASKSVVASGTGLVIAQNMMYRHTISVFDHAKVLVATVPDTVILSEADLTAVGIGGEPGARYQGAPVEAAFTPDGRYAYVSNYRMYGPGFTRDAGDSCNRDQGDPSFVYRLDMDLVATPEAMVDHVYAVGSVPKYVAVSPDGRLLLVTNWCSFDLTVIDLTTAATVATIDLGRHPRGIVVTPDSARAYVTVMGGSDIAVVDLASFATDWLLGIGQGPRHVVLSPDGATLYATLNGEGTVVKIDAATGEVVQRVRTGSAPRSMAISPDGSALYVVNYESDSMSKVRTADFEVLAEFETAHHPIGITYDRSADEVWVSCYSGVIHVFAET